MVDKLALLNSRACPELVRITLFIDLKSLEDFDSSRLLVAMFILRILSGQRPYISKFGLFQTFRERDYDALVRVDLSYRAAHRFVETMGIRILPFLPTADFTNKYCENSHGVMVNFSISDLSFMRIVETHSIFFKWHDKVRVDLEVRGTSDATHAQLLFSCFKFK